MLEYIANFITPISIGFISAFFGSLVALSKFKKEKLWERKEKAYEEIINALYDLLQHCEFHKEDFGQGTGLAKEKEQEFKDKYNTAFWNIKKATDIGAFVISSEAHSVLIELRNRESLHFEDNPPFDVYEHEFQCFQAALNEVVKIAKSELNATKV